MLPCSERWLRVLRTRFITAAAQTVLTQKSEPGRPFDTGLDAAASPAGIKPHRSPNPRPLASASELRAPDRCQMVSAAGYSI